MSTNIPIARKLREAWLIKNGSETYYWILESIMTMVDKDETSVKLNAEVPGPGKLYYQMLDKHLTDLGYFVAYETAQPGNMTITISMI